MNHKYRNCQNMDESDFELTPPSATVQFGQSVDLALRNNTPGNSTCVQVTGGPGKPKLALGSKGGFDKSLLCGGYRVAHYTDAPAKHYEDVTLRFTAPKAPRNVCEAHYTLNAQSWGQSQKVSVTATKPGGCGCSAFASVQAWKVALSSAYSGKATSKSVETTEDLKASHKADLASVLSANGGTQWRSRKVTGNVTIADSETDTFSTGTVNNTDTTYSGTPDNVDIVFGIDPATCTYSLTWQVSVEAESKSGSVTSPLFVTVLAGGVSGRPLPPGAALKVTGTLDITQDGNGLADYTKLEDLIGNGLGSHQGHITWSVSPASGP